MGMAATACCLLLCLLSERDHDEGIVLNTPDKLTWKAGPNWLQPGAQIAVLEGAPAEAGPFVFRVKLPDGYLIWPYTNSATERVTVVQGTFNTGLGGKADRSKTKAMAAGSYSSLGRDVEHFGWAKGETIIQFHGTGPFTIKYIYPPNDPRNLPPY